MSTDILVVDDETAIADLVEICLKNEGYTVHKFYNGTEALACVRRRHLDLAILDVMLPDGDGFTLLGQLQAVRDVPVLFLSARDEDEARLRGLGLGADDYITKPFLPQELLLRLRSVLRRVYGRQEEAGRLGETEILWGRGTVRREGRETALTAKELALLKKLWDSRGNIVTTDALCETLWDGPMVGYENTLMVHIRRLREKIEPDPSHPRYLLTVRGLGYRLERGDRP